MSVDCGLAQSLLKKFGRLEKRVTCVEGKSRSHQNLIEKSQKKLRKLKKTTTYRSKGKLSQKKPAAIPRLEVKEEIESINNDPLKSIKNDSKLNQRIVVRMGVRCDNVSRGILNPVEKSVEHGPANKTESTHRQRDAISVEISSKPKILVKKSHNCNFCLKSFPSFEDLSRHMRVHTGERPYKCKICSNSFKQLSYLKTHSRTHTGEKPFFCSVCSRAFAQNSDAKVHMRVHTGEKPFSCSVCSRAFANSSDLIKHKRIHTGEKPYSCSFCSKSFAQSTSRNDHIRTHTGEKPYSCSFCSKSFLRTQTLNDHIRTHTGEKPYSCSVCSKAFVQSTNLLQHSKTHADLVRSPILVQYAPKIFQQMAV